jgi:hypothetical protein
MESLRVVTCAKHGWGATASEHSKPVGGWQPEPKRASFDRSNIQRPGSWRRLFVLGPSIGRGPRTSDVRNLIDKGPFDCVYGHRRDSRICHPATTDQDGGHIPNTRHDGILQWKQCVNME